MIRGCIARTACLALILMGAAPPAAAQTEAELAVLRMFYTEKELTVVSAARAPLTISQTPENITVITADQIRRMNAHNLEDILRRVPGVYVGSPRDFGSSGAVAIQGSETRHVRVLLDGMNWNYIDAGVFQSNAVPVEIIERIEIIKGPASSAWGSSLGGVINIITKNTGYETLLSGVVQGSYGEGDSQDYRAAAAGATDPVGYYLYAGRQTSNGLVSDRDYERNSLFGKLSLNAFDRVTIGVAMGYSDPYYDNGQSPSQDYEDEHTYRTHFANLSVEAEFTRNLDGSLFAYALTKDNTDRTDTLGLGIWGDRAELFQKQRLEEDVSGAAARLVWQFGRHTAVFGADFETAELDKEFVNGAAPQGAGAPARLGLGADRSLWGVYANASLVFGDFSLSLGARYDDDEVSGSYFSPSAGATYQLTDATLLRVTGSSGFNTPILAASETGGFFLDPNPDLEPEEILSGQIGVETSELEFVWLKAAYFYHETRRALVKELYAAGSPSFNDLYFNRGEILRRGVEVEAETRPFYNVALYAGASYVNITPPNDNGAEDQYTFNAALKYDDGESWNAELWGRYAWWNFTYGFGGEYDDFIWNISVNKTVYLKDHLRAEIFCAVHNLFNGDQYYIIDADNPDRWVEAGVRFSF